jgi:hypothetical protein
MILSSTAPISPKDKHRKLIYSYTTEIRKLMRSYFLATETTETDVEFLTIQALALSSDLEAVLKTARNLSVVAKKHLDENIALLKIFQSSLIVTKKNIANSNRPVAIGQLYQHCAIAS